MTSDNFLITIVGPTAIGKTALSIQLAKHFKAEIIMRRVHEEGKGIVGSYIHEIAGQKKIETLALAEQENFPLKVLIKKQKRN